MESELPPNLQISSVLPSNFGDYRVDDASAMQALSAAEDAHFWHRSRNALIVKRLQSLGLGAGAPFVELGCGGGAVAAALADAGFDVVGVDGHVVRLREAARRADALVELNLVARERLIACPNPISLILHDEKAGPEGIGVDARPDPDRSLRDRPSLG